MPIEWENFIATVLGGTLAGSIGIVVTSYRDWRANQLELKNWYEQIIQEMEYANLVIEQHNQEGVAPSEVRERMVEVYSHLPDYRSVALATVDPKLLLLIMGASILAHEARTGRQEGAIIEFAMVFLVNHSPVQELKEETRRRNAEITVTFAFYISDAVGQQLQRPTVDLT